MNELDDDKQVSVLSSLSDELKLQAWLAGAEIRHPSVRQADTRKEVDALARLRDELRVQLHLGHLDAREEFEQLEDRWRVFKRLAARSVDEAEESVHDLLQQIRDGYARLRTGKA